MENVHPKVKKSYRGLRFALYFTAGLLVLLAAVPYPFYHREFPDQTGHYLMFVVTPMAIALIVVLLVAKLWIEPRMRRMSEVMRTVSGRELLVEGRGMTVRGKETIDVFESGSEQAVMSIWLKTPNEGLWFNKGERTTVLVYHDDSFKDRMAVVEFGERLIWGERIDNS